jgi:ornithine--oxo-acid transaminase
MHLTEKSQALVDLENTYGGRNYAPLPVVLSRGQGARVWDVDGKEYLDFLSAYSAVNQGHCHPKIIAALKDQAERLTLTSRAFYNDQLGAFEKWLCELLGFDRMIPMNSGAEAVETAMKLARRWGYDVKGVAADQAKIIVCDDNFHGRTIGIISASTDPDSRGGFGPYTPGFITVPYGDLTRLEQELRDPNVVGFLVEPIQGEAGVVVPPEGFLSKAAQLCKSARVLFMADEVQTGLARTGRMLACDHEGVKPDVLILGKALSGGVLPVSAVLSSSEVILTIKPGQHGSTFGGNPLACAVARAAVQVLIDEDLAGQAESKGQIFREGIAALHSPIVERIRGKGLLNAVVIKPHGKNAKGQPKTAYDICHELAEYGVLAKQTHVHTIRFAPPLVITKEELQRGISIIGDVLKRSSQA